MDELVSLLTIATRSVVATQHAVLLFWGRSLRQLLFCNCWFSQQATILSRITTCSSKFHYDNNHWPARTRSAYAVYSSSRCKNMQSPKKTITEQVLELLLIQTEPACRIKTRFLLNAGYCSVQLKTRLEMSIQQLGSSIQQLGSSTQQFESSTQQFESSTQQFESSI